MTLSSQRGLRVLSRVVLGAIVVTSSLWAAAALFFDSRITWLGWSLAGGYIAATLAAWLGIKRRGYAAALNISLFLLVLAWWLTLQPSNHRDWQPDLAVLPYADLDGSKVTLHNIRNCRYRSETDFDVSYYDASLNLDHLRSADLFLVYWGASFMAHTMVSFGFEDGKHVCFSIETRKEKGETYSAIRGLFRQYELIYVVADERDLVRLRTNFRQGEEVYLYRLQGSPEQVRRFFFDYLRSMNALLQKPKWYNALTDNCSTAIRTQRAAADRAPWDWRMLANGYGDELLYERGVLFTNLPLEELKQRGHLNARAKALNESADFSRLIRQGVPGIDQ